MPHEVSPGQVHALAERVAEAAEGLRREAGELNALVVADAGFETDAMLARLSGLLGGRWDALADEATALSEAIHDSASRVEQTEAANTELAREFFRRAGGEQ